MSQAKDGAKRRPGIRSIGLLGLVTAALQYGIGVKNDITTQRAFQQVVVAQMQAQKAQIQATQEREFVRKTDLDRTLNRLDRKLDQVDEKMDRSGKKLAKIEGYLKAKQPRTWSWNP